MVNVLFFKRAGKEFHAAGSAQEKARLPYVESRHHWDVKITASR